MQGFFRKGSSMGWPAAKAAGPFFDQDFWYYDTSPVPI